MSQHTPTPCIENPNLIDISALKNDKFWFSIFGAPKELDWSVTGIYIPGTSIGNEQLYVNRFPVNNHGDTITTEPCVIEFKISNNLKNYLFFNVWMQKLIVDDEQDKDITVFVTDTNDKPKPIGFILKNAFPVDLSGIRFTIEEDSIDLRATVTLAIDVWNITIDGKEITDTHDYVLGCGGGLPSDIGNDLL